MKKIVSILVALTMLITSMSTFALSYGEEWENYTHSAPTTYTDVPSTHWAYNAIMRVTEKNWFNGYPDGRFNPDGAITRSEALKVFVVFLGYELSDVTESSFYDVDAKAWYAPYVEAGKELFPTHTTIQGKRPFQPDMPVTREDTIYALTKGLGCTAGVKYVDQSVLNMFSDKSSISGDIKPAFAIAVQHGLVSGFPDGTIRGQAALSRAEFATLLLRGTEHGFHDVYDAIVESVKVSPSSPVDMTLGETITLSARATYTDGTNKAYTNLDAYDENNKGVVSINGTTITAVKEGTATIKFNDSNLKGQSIVINVKAPTDAPVIKTTDYDEVTDKATATIKGTVTDKNGAVDLTCNGKDVAVDTDGSFVVNVSLKVGDNTIKFVAKNKYGVEGTKTLIITREESATKPVVTPGSDDEDEEDEEDEEVVTEPSKKDDDDSDDSDDNSYYTFDKATGTITACGTSADDIVVPEKINGVNVYHIGEGAFKDCTYLEYIELPDTLKSIKDEAFAGCIRLQEIVIPEGTTSLGESVFEGCKSLTSVVIPEGIKKLPANLFDGCKRLTDVSLPEGLKKIEDEVFAGCTSLKSLELPETVTSIGSGAFDSCGALVEIFIPDSVTEIADDTFAGCNAVTIYASVNSYAVEYAEENSIAWAIN